MFLSKDRIIEKVFTSGAAFLSSFTLLTQFATLTGRSFVFISIAFGFAAFVAVLGWFRPLSLSELPELRLPEIGLNRGCLVPSVIWSSERIPIIVLPILLLGTIVIHNQTMTLLPYWILGVITCLYFLIRRQRNQYIHVETLVAKNADAEPSFAFFIKLSLIVCVLYLCTSIPDSDDSLFLNFAIGAKNSAGPIYTSDTMLGIEGLGFIKSTYKLESYQLLTAVVSDLTGLSVLTTAHTVLPLILCVWALSVLILLHRMLLPDMYRQTAVIHLTLLLSLDGSLQSYGYHGFFRFFQGKAVFLVVVLPIIAVLTLLCFRSRSYLPVWLLAIFNVIAIGFTANAIYVAPLCSLVIALACFTTDRDNRWKIFRLLITVLFPMLLAVFLLLYDPPFGSQFTDSGTLGGVIWALFPSSFALLFFLCSLFILLCVVALSNAFRIVSIYALFLLVLVLNPLLWPLYGEYVTGHINYRLFWVLPFPLILAITAGLLLRMKNRVLTTLVVAFIVIPLFAKTSILRKIEFGPGLHKVPELNLAVANKVVSFSGQGTLLLAPEEIAWIVTTIESAPYVVEGREIYSPQRKSNFLQDELRARAELFRIWNQANDTELNESNIQEVDSLFESVAVEYLLAKANSNSHQLFLANSQVAFNKLWSDGNYELYQRIN